VLRRQHTEGWGSNLGGVYLGDMLTIVLADDSAVHDRIFPVHFRFGRI
jgi:hypothetical protein